MSVEKLSQEGIALIASCADGRGHVNDLDQPSTYDGNIPMPIPVPTLVLMLKSTSICQGDGDNDLYLNHEVRVQVSPQISRMKQGEITDYEGLFDPFILAITPPSSHLYVLSPIVSMLVAQEEVSLELVGFNSELHELYRRI
jgi:hypothetical protein